VPHVGTYSHSTLPGDKSDAESLHSGVQRVEYRDVGRHIVEGKSALYQVPKLVGMVSLGWQSDQRHKVLQRLARHECVKAGLL